jgi:hypothetical protein
MLDDRLHVGESVLHAMIKFPQQQLLGRLRTLAIRDVAGDLEAPITLPLASFRGETASEISMREPSLR